MLVQGQSVQPSMPRGAAIGLSRKGPRSPESWFSCYHRFLFFFFLLFLLPFGCLCVVVSDRVRRIPPHAICNSGRSSLFNSVADHTGWGIWSVQCAVPLVDILLPFHHHYYFHKTAPRFSFFWFPWFRRCISSQSEHLGLAPVRCDSSEPQYCS